MLTTQPGGKGITAGGTCSRRWPWAVGDVYMGVPVSLWGAPLAFSEPTSMYFCPSNMPPWGSAATQRRGSYCWVGGPVLKPGAKTLTPRSQPGAGMVCTLRRRGRRKGWLGTIQAPAAPPLLTQGLAWLGSSLVPLPTTHTRVHTLRSTHLAGAGTPQVHAGPQPHAEHIEGGPVHQVQVKVVLQLRSVQDLEGDLGDLARGFPWRPQ